MPELPEVERGRVIAEGACRGKKIMKVYAAEDDIVFDGVSPRAFANALKGRRVERVCRKGKQLWMELDEGPHPLFHFGMTGDFRAYTDASDRHRFCKCELLMDDGTRLGMKNARRLGRIKLRDDPENQPPISRLGFDPLVDPPTPTRFIEMLGQRRGVLKGLLLNQSFAAGIGNWIADEVLYQAGIRPDRDADSLSDEEAKLLLRKIKYVCKKAVEWDADYKRFPDTWLFLHRWSKRESKRAHIEDGRGYKLKFEAIAGRTTVWCPAVQC